MTFSKMQSNFTYFSHIISLLYICLNQKRHFVGYCAIFRMISSIITIFLLLIRFLTTFFFPEKPFSAVKNRQISKLSIFLWSNCTFPKARTHPAFSVDTHSVVQNCPFPLFCPLRTHYLRYRKPCIRRPNEGYVYSTGEICTILPKQQIHIELSR